MSEDANLIEPSAADSEGGAGDGMRIKLDVADILSFGDDSHTLCVLGSPGDSLEAGGGWTPIGQETLDGAVFNVYVQDGAILKVDVDIDQSLIGIA